MLPLVNLGGNASDDYFGIGLAEEMTRALSKAGARVIGRSSAGALQARGLDDRAIARELGVGSLLAGSIQRDAGTVRISVSLVSASDGSVSWSERYGPPLTNMFALQDEIARVVAAQLPGGAARVTAPAPVKQETADTEAYALYLQGQVLFGRRTAQTMRQAISLFEQAVQRDSTFARAHAASGLAYAAVPYYEHGTVSETLCAEAAARRALALDPELGEAYAAIGSAHMSRLQSRAADENFRRAILDSTAAIAWGWHALVLSHRGQFAEAHRAVQRARALEPASLISRTWEAQIFLNEHRPVEAAERSRATLVLDNAYPLALDANAVAQSDLGAHDEAIASLKAAIARRAASRPARRRAPRDRKMNLCLGVCLGVRHLTSTRYQRSADWLGVSPVSHSTSETSTSASECPHRSIWFDSSLRSGLAMTILMTMVTASKSALKARMLEYFRRIEETGEELIVTSDGRPVLRVVPYIEKQPVDAVFADIRGALTFTGDPDESTSSEWTEK